MIYPCNPRRGFANQDSHLRVRRFHGRMDAEFFQRFAGSGPNRRHHALSQPRARRRFDAHFSRYPQQVLNLHGCREDRHMELARGQTPDRLPQRPGILRQTILVDPHRRYFRAARA